MKVKVDNISFKELVKHKFIVIIHPFENHEILCKDKMLPGGAARLIREFYIYSKELDCKAILVPLSALSPFLFIIFKFRYISRIKMKKILSNGFFELVIKHIPLGIMIILQDFFMNVDPFVKINLQMHLRKKNITKSDDVVIIYNFPWGAKGLRGKFKVIVYEHDIEWLYFKHSIPENLQKNGIIRLLIYILSRLEIANITRAYLTLAVNNNDAHYFCKLGISTEMLVPLNVKCGVSVLDLKKKEKLKLCFLGSFASQNIIAVKALFKIAPLLSSRYDILIVGGVGEAFKQIESQYIKFTGHVEDFDKYLKECDVFVNPKFSHTTGVEVKMFDYIKYCKPIVTTKIGANGFEKFSNVIIVNSLKDFAKKLLEL